jgi:hypothetical protein
MPAQRRGSQQEWWGAVETLLDDLTAQTRRVASTLSSDEDEVLWQVRLLDEAARRLPLLLATAIDEARTRGASWAQIAHALGMQYPGSAQGRYRRWLEAVEERGPL